MLIHNCRVNEILDKAEEAGEKLLLLDEFSELELSITEHKIVHDFVNLIYQTRRNENAID